MEKVFWNVDASQIEKKVNFRNFSLGQGGQSSEPFPEKVVERLQEISPSFIRLFVQEYFNLYPSHNKYNWKKLDKVVESIKKTGAKPLFCLAIKPKILYSNYFSDKEPVSWEEWERLLYNIVKHYPEVEYWELFNEPDIGGGGTAPGHLPPGTYLNYYRHFVSAVKKINPGAKVGGPTVAFVGKPIFRKFLEGCAKENLPLNFVSWHLYSISPLRIGKTVSYTKNLLAQYNLRCETIIDEWNMPLHYKSSYAEYGRNPEVRASFVAATIKEFIDKGLDKCFYYQIIFDAVKRKEWENWYPEKGLESILKEWNEKNKEKRCFHIMERDGKVNEVFYFFKMLYSLYPDLLKVKGENIRNCGIIATKKEDNIKALLYNYSPRKKRKVLLNVSFENLKNRKKKLMISSISREGIKKMSEYKAVGNIVKIEYPLGENRIISVEIKSGKD